MNAQHALAQPGPARPASATVPQRMQLLDEPEGVDHVPQPGLCFLEFLRGIHRGESVVSTLASLMVSTHCITCALHGTY
jgi:hypothetical protein